jgi:pyrroline-5-carboxylate reductase
MKKIGFIGVGNMGSAIMKAVVKTTPAEYIYIADKNEGSLQAFSAQYGVNISTNEDIAKNCDYVFLGVKPQMMEEMLSSVKDVLKNKKNVLISMAAGLEMFTLSRILEFDAKIIRIMPNLPVSVGEGMTLYDSSELVTGEEIAEFLSFMSKTGKLIQLPEHLIDAGCAVSGCGPAFVCMVIEAMADAGVKCGLTRSTALTLATQTLLGTSLLISETETHPAMLKDAVCSPAGSTIAGVEALESNGLRAAFIEAVTASYNRNKELGKQ